MPNMQMTKTPAVEQDPIVRSCNFNEVSSGYTTFEMAKGEAERCLQCKNMPCVSGCPVNVRIPEFIKALKEGDLAKSHEILKSTDDYEFHLLAENVAHYHHERWDGSGYPEGLKDRAIPPEARIMAIADVYDALVSKRVYKEEFSFEKADSIIMEGMGTQFDPALRAAYEAARPGLEAYYSTERE